MAERKHTQKWYNKNEFEVMSKLGLTPTKRSGAGWIEKEDGYNEEIIAQLKSTDANSFKLSRDDLRKLEYHATVDKKKPLFVVQFIERETYLIMRQEDMKDICLSLLGVERMEDLKYDDKSEIDVYSDCEKPIIKKVKSNRKAREQFMKERESKWQKKR